MYLKSLFPVFFFFWLVAFNKNFLFWVYLWQLKEYHFGRFLDHFHTDKGKKLLFSKLNFLKLALIIFPFTFRLFIADLRFNFFIGYLFAVFFLFLAAGGKTFLDIRRKKIKVPVFTKKIILIVSSGLVLEGLIFVLASRRVLLETYDFPFYFSTLFYFYFLIFFLLILDFLAPVFSTIVVFLWHPFAVFWRKIIIRKAKKKRSRFPGLKVVGITGSYGKTSTKEFLATILSEKFKVVKTKAHQNSEIGISQCLLNDLGEKDEVFICEMGAYGKGGIKLLSEIVRPQIGILTGINEQHMATYGSQDNIIQTKFELVQALPEDGLIILNDSDPKIKSEKLKIKNYNPKLKNIKLYSITAKGDIWADNIKVEKESVSFRVFSKDGDSMDFRVNLIGGHNVLNILGAAAAAKEMGMSLKEISRASEKIRPFQAGVELKKSKQGLNILDATYSANPSGLDSHLEYLENWKGKKAVVMPCLIELGPASKKLHRIFGEKIGKTCQKAIIITREHLEDLKQGAARASQDPQKFLFMEDPGIIFEEIKRFSGKEDIILLESRVQKKLIDLLFS
jgi:UDP-N-acetylmuramoyl-tripeptide--D-alanyl-D-alanine ligase